MKLALAIIAANALLYLLVAFLMWDVAWISPIAHWPPCLRALVMSGSLLSSFIAVGITLERRPNQPLN